MTQPLEPTPTPRPLPDLPVLAQRLHDAACGCGEQLAGTWSTYWQNIARAAIAELVP